VSRWSLTWVLVLLGQPGRARGPGEDVMPKYQTHSVDLGNFGHDVAELWGTYQNWSDVE
jgi:hypothetical protein